MNKFELFYLFCYFEGWFYDLDKTITKNNYNELNTFNVNNSYYKYLRQHLFVYLTTY